MQLSKIRIQERSVVEELQKVAAADEESRRLNEKKEDSMAALETRGVFFADSPVTEYQALLKYLKQVSIYDELAIKWVENFSQLGKNPLVQLYPKDHWLHNSENFNKKLSKEYEEDGFCWTSKGGSWKNNLSIKQANTEIKLAKIRADERALITKEEERVEAERNRKEMAEIEAKSVESLESRGAFIPDSPVTNYKNLASYLTGISSDSEIASKWSEYFSNNRRKPLSKLYPEDHWLHSPEDFDEKLSNEFEGDGFCWTPKGGVWKPDLSIEQAKAEVRLAEIKLKQKKVLEEEQAKLERIKG